MKKFFILVFMLLISSVSTAETINECDAILVLGFDEYQIFTQEALNSAYAEMFTKSDTELDEIERNSQKNSSLSGSYKLISATWSKNKNDAEWRKKFNESRESYQKSAQINTDFTNYTSSRTVKEETVIAWQECIKSYFATKKIKTSLATEIIGDKTGNFTLIIHFNPKNESEHKAVKIASISISPSLTMREPINLAPNGLINPYTGLSQSFTRTRNDETSIIAINLEGQPTLTVEIKPEKKASSGVPLGTIISSTLTYAELCASLEEPTTWNVNNTWAPADGRQVNSSLYGRLYNTVPDLRGVFIRGLNQFYTGSNGSGSLKSGQLDEDNSRSAGSFQMDATAKPKNAFTTGNTGNHYHLQGYDDTALSGKFGKEDAGARAGRYEHSPDGSAGGNSSSKTSTAGTHVHNITGGGDNETRPKNVAVYYYIKIN